MFKAEYIEVSYVPSDSIERQGTQFSIERYIKSGYFVQVNRNGYWLLVRPAKVMVTVHSAGKFFTYDMKGSILNLYDRNRISSNLIEKFKNDFSRGAFKIFVDEYGYSIEN